MADEEESKHETSPSLSPSLQVSSKQDPIHNRSFSDSYTHQNNFVFPPINHEDLHNRPPSPPSESLISSPLSLPERYPGDWCDVARRWVEQLGIRVVRAVSWVRNYCASRDGNRSFRVAGVAVAVMVWWVYVAVGRRKRLLMARKASRDHLVLLIKEKDEKIKQLLNQIAQMNHILLSLHKCPPSQGGQVT